MKAISFVIPAYNAGNTIVRTMESMKLYALMIVRRIIHVRLCVILRNYIRRSNYYVNLKIIVKELLVIVGYR